VQPLAFARKRLGLWQPSSVDQGIVTGSGHGRHDNEEREGSISIEGRSAVSRSIAGSIEVGTLDEKEYVLQSQPGPSQFITNATAAGGPEDQFAADAAAWV
jgi:hypothetical protein